MSEDPEEKKTRPVRGRPSTLDPAQVTEIAMAAYWETDPAEISLNEVCKRAGVSKPSLYRAFGGEDGLMRAALDLYAERVLADVFGLLRPDAPLSQALEALADFATDAPRMERGCLFYKMRGGKHRLGPQTRARVEEIDAAALAGYETFLRARRDAGDWSEPPEVAAAAAFLSEQVAWALTQRAAGADKAHIRATLEVATSVLLRA